MRLTQKIKTILRDYDSDNPGTKANLARILGTGRLGGTGRMIIYPVDQGFEHGPARSFAVNAEAYDPHYHHKLAIDSGCNAYAAPLGMLELTAAHYPGALPLILKINSANSLRKEKNGPTQAVTATVKDAVRLGCSAIGFTIYPGSDNIYSMLNELRELTAEAKSYGLAVVVWSYARGSTVSKEGELSLDVISYGAHMACLMGAHIIKVKLPTDYLDQPEAKKAFEDHKVPIKTLAQRVAHVKQSCFEGRRLVVFSGGEAKDVKSVLSDTRAIHEGGGNGSIVGRNCFQRPRDEGMKLIADMVSIYQGKS